MQKTTWLILILLMASMLVLSGCNLFSGGGGGEIVLEPEEIELGDVDDDGTGDINNPETMTEDDWQDMAEAYEDLFEETDKEKKKTVKGSCDVIAEKSTCVDYIGSYWETPELAALNCKGVGVYSSDKTCPYTRYGGCKTGAGTINEMIIWHYPEGGGGFDDENIQYAIGACNANPLGTWTTPDAEFLR